MDRQAGNGCDIELVDSSKNNTAVPGYLRLGVPVVFSLSGGRSSKKLKMVSYMDSTFDRGDIIQRHHHRCLYPNQARGAMTRWMRPKQAAAGKRRGRFPAMGGAPCQASALHTYRGKGNAAASSLVWMTTSFWVGLVMAT